jgi:NAD(P)-dependent dehydrogenase (short-subunit alcohol dehydrogenase family)
VAETIVWITGASAGIGAALASSVPYDNARVINLSRSAASRVENVQLDLTDPEQWTKVSRHWEEELESFEGSLVLLIHNAAYMESFGFVGEMDPDEYLRQVMANVAAPLYLGQAFVRACNDRFESGIVLMSSALVPTAGAASYCAGKAAIEMWVRSVADERQRRGGGPWLIAVRPGHSDTPGSRRATAADPHDFPVASQLRALDEAGVTGDAVAVARQIWQLIDERPASGTIIDLGGPFASEA